MKNIFLFLSLLFLFSCGDNKRTVNVDSLKTDSVLRALQANSIPSTPVSTDTLNAAVLPPVFEGDIVMQISDNPQHVAFGKASGSKYNNAGIIFMRPRDRMYMVMQLDDSIVGIPLTKWRNRGQGDHIALLRLKNSNQLLSEKKTTLLKKTAQEFRKSKQDYSYSWSDETFYSTELIWKLYEKSVNITICEPGKLGDLDLTDPLISGQMKKKYGDKIPKNEKFVSPDAIYKSPKLEIIYER